MSQMFVQRYNSYISYSINSPYIGDILSRVHSRIIFNSVTFLMVKMTATEGNIIMKDRI